jgi:hypothetical protein
MFKYCSEFLYEMVDARIQAIFEKYVRLFEQIGPENFGFRKGLRDPNLEIYAFDPKGGIVLASLKFQEGWNCGLTAQALAQDLYREGLDKIRLKTTHIPGITGSMTQHYVEVFDPGSRENIQIDATPWFSEMGFFHDEKEDMGFDVRQESHSPSVIINRNMRQFVATTKTEEGTFVDISFGVNYHSIEDFLCTRQGSGYPMGFPDFEIPPDYLFQICVSESDAATHETKTHFRLYYAIPNSKALLRAQSNGLGDPLQNPLRYLETLIAEGVAQVHVEDASRYFHNARREMKHPASKRKGGDSFSYLDTLVERGEATISGVNWLKENLFMISNVVSKLRPQLPTMFGYHLTPHYEFGGAFIDRGLRFPDDVKAAQNQFD